MPRIKNHSKDEIRVTRKVKREAESADWIMNGLLLPI